MKCVPHCGHTLSARKPSASDLLAEDSLDMQPHDLVLPERRLALVVRCSTPQSHKHRHTIFLSTRSPVGSIAKSLPNLWPAKLIAAVIYKGPCLASHVSISE